MRDIYLKSADKILCMRDIQFESADISFYERDISLNKGEVIAKIFKRIKSKVTK